MERDAAGPAVRLTTSDVQDRLWLLHDDHGGDREDRRLRFLVGGVIEGDDSGLLLRWEVKGGCLRLMGGGDALAMECAEPERALNKLRLSGRRPGDENASLTLSELKSLRRFNHTRESLEASVTKHGWSIGDHTYGAPEVAGSGLANLTIGKYTSIAAGVRIALGDHRSDTMTTYPFMSLPKYWAHLSPELEDHTTKGDVVIGNDVWIGSNVFIGSGVTIGDGAVIGAHTIVTKDVPPYAIVVGNPGRVARYRFSPETIAELQDLEWWDLPDDVVDSLIPLLLQTDAEAFLLRLRALRRSS
jgi:acetyltransferase-like isoleucine patch superfamily enzyme